MKIMVFGTFDIIHPGHINMLKQAKELADELIVIVARDETVKLVKGEYPANNLAIRIKKLSKLNFIDRVIPGNKVDYFQSIKKENPGIIALGYDQKFNVDELMLFIKKNNLDIKIIRLKPFSPHKYKTSLIKQKINKEKK